VGFWTNLLGLGALGVAGYVVVKGSENAPGAGGHRAPAKPASGAYTHDAALVSDAAFAMSKASDDLAESGTRGKAISIGQVRRASDYVRDAVDALENVSEDHATHAQSLARALKEFNEKLRGKKGKSVPQPGAEHLADESHKLWLRVAKYSAKLEPSGDWGYTSKL
jgi:hypothetical protein